MEIMLVDKRFYFYRIPLFCSPTNMNMIPGTTVLRGSHEKFGLTLEGAHLCFLSGESLLLSLIEGRVYYIEMPSGPSNYGQSGHLVVEKLYDLETPKLQIIPLVLASLKVFKGSQKAYLTWLPVLNGPFHTLAIFYKQNPEKLVSKTAVPSTIELEDDDDLYSTSILQSKPVTQETTVNERLGGRPSDYFSLNESYDLFILQQHKLPSLYLKYPVLSRYDRKSCLSGLTGRDIFCSQSKMLSTNKISGSPLGENPCIGLWTVYPDTFEEETTQGYLILSFESSTLVLSIYKSKSTESSSSSQIRELESGEFYLEGTTIFVEILKDVPIDVNLSSILQVHERGFKILNYSASSTLVDYYLEEGIIQEAKLKGSILYILKVNGELLRFNLGEINLQDRDFSFELLFTEVNTFEIYSDIKDGHVDAIIAKKDGILIHSKGLNTNAILLEGFDVMAMTVSNRNCLYLLTRKQGLYLYKLVLNIQSILHLRPLSIPFITFGATGLRKISFFNNNLLGDEAVVLLGPRPLWFLHSYSSLMRTSPTVLTGDGPIYAASEYRTTTSGLAVLGPNNTLSLVALPNPNKWTLGSESIYALNKVENILKELLFIESEASKTIVSENSTFGCLDQAIYIPDANTFVCVESNQEPFMMPSEDHTVGTLAPEFLKKEIPLCPSLRQRLILVSGETFQLIDRPTNLVLNSYERVTAQTLITLPTATTLSKKKVYLVIGTTYVRSEDRPVRGRILLLDVIPVNPDPKYPAMAHKLKLLETEDVKGKLSYKPMFIL